MRLPEARFIEDFQHPELTIFVNLNTHARGPDECNVYKTDTGQELRAVKSFIGN
jgi:hypothetical protein